MSTSKEPAHSEKHVDRILSSLDFLMTKFPKLFNHVNLEVLVTSIIYHDLWKSEQPLTADKGVRALIKENFIFEPEMRDVGPAIGLASSILEKTLTPTYPLLIDIDESKNIILKLYDKKDTTKLLASAEYELLASAWK